MDAVRTVAGVLSDDQAAVVAWLRVFEPAYIFIVGGRGSALLGKKIESSYDISIDAKSVMMNICWAKDDRRQMGRKLLLMLGFWRA